MDKELHELTGQQKEKVEYLFADAVFGTDPADFLYEIDDKGGISGRRNKSTKAQKTLRRARTTQVKVDMVPVPASEITKGMIDAMNTHMDALAADISRNIFNNQINAGGEQ
jgi:hypothetical protein